MCKQMTANALRLKEYINSIKDFYFVAPDVCPYKNHIGAILTDAILQSGVNYKYVVWPRVQHILNAYPFANTVSSFLEVLDDYGTANVLHLANKVKTTRLHEITLFCQKNGIETTRHLTEFLKYDSNIELLKQIDGIGDKTCDYLKRLLGFDIVAVDRHIRSFIENADIMYSEYNDIKDVVEYAADFMKCTRRMLDYSIWTYMAGRNQKNEMQLSFDFQ